MGFDRYFGFDLQQRKTLMRLFAELEGGDTDTLEELQDQIDALEARVADLEAAAGPDA